MKRYSRRDFVKGLGGASLGLNFLPSLMTKSGQALAESATPPKYAIFCFTSNGSREAYWEPFQGKRLATIAGAQQLSPEVWTYPFSSLSGNISPLHGSWLTPYKNKLTMVSGLDYLNKDGDHLPQTFLTGYSLTNEKHVSLDQQIAKAIYSASPVVRSHNLLVQGNQGGGGSISYQNVGGTITEVNQQVDPQGLFDLYLKNVGLGGGPSQPLNDKISVVDRAWRNFSSLYQSSKLSAADKQRVDQHLTHLQSLQSSLNSQKTPTACSPPARPVQAGTKTYPFPTPIEVTLDRDMKNMIDVAVAMIRCGLTQVITLQFCPETDYGPFMNIPEIGGHHGISHDSGQDAKKLVIEQWYSQKFAYLLSQLDVPDGTGKTFLDNSIVFWGNSAGAQVPDDFSHAHDCWNMPVLIAGSAGGNLEPGKFIDYRSNKGIYYSSTNIYHPNRGRPYGQLLMSLGLTLGLTTSQIEEPGQVGFGDYRNDLNDQYGAFQATAVRRSKLPGM